jgi:hypothetical protein
LTTKIQALEVPPAEAFTFSCLIHPRTAPMIAPHAAAAPRTSKMAPVHIGTTPVISSRRLMWILESWE